MGPARRAIPTSGTKALRAGFLLVLVWWIYLPASIRAQGAATPAPTPPAHATPPSLSFENYKMVRTRNIFDPDRRPLTTAPTAVAAPIKQSDYVALTGTLLNAGKALAFFSGSRDDFNKVLGVRDKIANATITDISAAGVQVDRGGRKITVAVGQTVPLDNSAPGVPPAPAVQIPLPATGAVGSTDTAPGGAPSPSPAPATASAPAGAPAAANSLSAKQQEIMKRMMEKRRQDGLQ